MVATKQWIDDPDFLTQEKLLIIIDFIGRYYAKKSHTQTLMVPVSACPVLANELVPIESVDDGLQYVKPHASFDWIFLIAEIVMEINPLAPVGFLELRQLTIDNAFISLVRSINDTKKTVRWTQFLSQ